MKENKQTVEEVEIDIDIDEQLELQKKGWIVQRVGWILILSIALAGALGAFGGGILSKKSATSNNVTVEYESLYRYETEMKVLVEAPVHIGSLAFTQQYLKSFRIIRFVPDPANNSTIGDYISYNFLPGNNKIVTVYLIPKSYGLTKGVMKVNETSTFKLSHFIFP